MLFYLKFCDLYVQHHMNKFLFTLMDFQNKKVFNFIIRYFKLWFPVRSNSLSLKYQRFRLSGCKHIRVSKFEFVTKTQFLYFRQISSNTPGPCTAPVPHPRPSINPLPNFIFLPNSPNIYLNLPKPLRSFKYSPITWNNPSLPFNDPLSTPRPSHSPPRSQFWPNQINFYCTFKVYCLYILCLIHKF